MYVIPLFSNEYKVMPDIRRGKVETVYTHRSSGETYILVLNQALIFGNTIQHLLLTFNQMSAHGVTTCDVPTFNRVIFDDDGENATLPLRLRGVISFSDTGHLR